jgi:hypothetical protein
MTKATVKWLGTRKLTKQGGALYISIPVEFCKKNGMEKGSPLDIYMDTGKGDKIILKIRNTNLKNKKEGE